MFRTGPQVSAHDKEKQKQKKRLSFKDPEIEGPKKSGGSVAGAKQVVKSPVKEPPKRRSDTGGSDSVLEDQALKIAHSVGRAFSHPETEVSIPRPHYIQSVSNSKSRINSYQEGESASKDLSELDNSSYQKRSAFKSYKTSENERDYLDALSPALPDSTMRCPPVEMQNVKPKNGLSSTAGQEFQGFPTGAQHQIQILRYQLEQQGQQTQTAFHQVELLKGQLDAESSARYKAQTQNHQLMLQNKELLDHIERLFKQIEDLEKHVEILEQDKKLTKIPYLQEPQEQSRWSGTYAGRRLSSDQSMNERPSSTTRNPSATNRRGSLTSTTKINPPQTKTTPTPTPTQNPTNRRGSLTSSLRPYATIQSKPTETANKPSDSTLRIGDATPTTQKISNPFNSSWKSKLQGTNSSTSADKTETKPRTNSLTTTSYSKLKSTDSKQTLFGSCTLATPSSAVSKKSSSSTSDLYKSENISYPSTSKSLMIEEPSLSNSNGAISSVGAKESSKLPQYQQKFSSWQRSKTMISDRVSGIDKETFKNAPETSLLFTK